VRPMIREYLVRERSQGTWALTQKISLCRKNLLQAQIHNLLDADTIYPHVFLFKVEECHDQETYGKNNCDNNWGGCYFHAFILVD
jgi:hypothetical protein